MHSTSDSRRKGRDIFLDNFQKNLQTSIDQARNPPPDTTALGQVVQPAKAERAQREERNKYGILGWIMDGARSMVPGKQKTLK
jgi:hypothetical protein